MKLADGIEHKIGRRAQHGALRGGGPISEFVDAFVAVSEALQNMNHGFIAEQIAALRVRDCSGVVEQHTVGLASVYVQHASLLLVPDHLHYPPHVSLRHLAALTPACLVSHLA